LKQMYEKQVRNDSTPLVRGGVCWENFGIEEVWWNWNDYVRLGCKYGRVTGFLHLDVGQVGQNFLVRKQQSIPWTVVRRADRGRKEAPKFRGVGGGKLEEIFSLHAERTSRWGDIAANGKKKKGSKGGNRWGRPHVPEGDHGLTVLAGAQG